MRRRTSSPLRRDVEAVDAGAALRRREQAAEDPDERRLARAVGAEQAVDLAARHAQRARLSSARNLPKSRETPSTSIPYSRETLRHHGSASRTVAAMPGFSSGAGSIATLTPKTWSIRWSSVWTLRGVYSDCVRISTTCPANSRFGIRVHGHGRLLSHAHAAELGLGHVDPDPELRRLEHLRDRLIGPDEVSGPQIHGLDDAGGRGEDGRSPFAGAPGSRAVSVPRSRRRAPRRCPRAGSRVRAPAAFPRRSRRRSPRRRRTAGPTMPESSIDFCRSRSRPAF